MLSKIDIKFINDWSLLIKKYQKFQRVLNAKPSSGEYIEGYKTFRYDFGTSGSLVSYDSIVSGTDVASSANGKIVEAELPWIDKLKQNMSELNIQSVTFQSNFGSLNPHCDGQEESGTIFHCKLNYIIDDYWVNGTGQRYIFQICFHQKYSEVLEWFNDHPGLVYF